MNIPGRHASPPRQGWPTQPVSGPSFSRTMEYPPYLRIHDILGRPYPSLLLRRIETAILGKEGMVINENFFLSMADTLASTLRSLSEHCAIEDFWTCIRTLRLEVDTLLRQGRAEADMIRNRPNWQLTDMPGLPWPEKDMNPPSLQELAQDCIARAMNGTPALAEDIAAHQTTLVLILFHIHISEFTMTVRRCRPALWQLSGPLERNASFHIEVARTMVRHAQDEPGNAPELWRGIYNLLSLAGFHVDRTGMRLPEGALTNSQMLTAIAMENLHQQIAALFNEDTIPVAP